MTDEKKIKVMIEVPEKWFDIESPSILVGRTIGEQLLKALKESLAEQYINKVQLPEFKVTADEVKDRIIQILAERALEK